MSTSQKLKIPVWWSRRHIIFLAFLYVGLTLLISVFFIAFSKDEFTEEAETRNQLYVNMLDEVSGDLFSSIDAVVRTFDESLGRIDIAELKSTDLRELDRILVDIFRDRPIVRSFSIISTAGKVLASSSGENTDQTIDLLLLGKLPSPNSSTLLSSELFGRELHLLRKTRLDQSHSPVLPMVRASVMADGRVVYLVALINLDYVGSSYARFLNRSPVQASLLSYSGTLLNSSDNSFTQPGDSVQHLTLFNQFLPVREFGHYHGDGMNETDSLVSFRTLRKWPLIVLVETPYSEISTRLEGLIRAVTTIACALLLLMFGITFVALRSLGRHQLLLKTLEETNQAAAASDARNSAVLSSAMDAVLTIDIDGIVVAFNPAAEKIFGYTEEQALGQLMSDLIVPPELRDAHKKGMQRYLDTKVSHILNTRVEITAMRSNQSTFPVELTIVSVQSNGKQYFTATLRDITEQKQNEAEKSAILESHRQVARALEAQKQALDEHAIVSIVDASGSIVYANDKLVEISGFQRDELIGQKYWELREHTLSEKEYRQMRRNLEANLQWHGETAHHRQDGSRYWVASTYFPVMGIDGKLRELITIQTDITARRETELALAAAHYRELEIGTHIQKALLVAPPTEINPGLLLSTYNQASQGIDGDFFDVIRVGDEVVDVIVGDVMGKGIPAALLGAATKLQFNRSITELLSRRNPNDALVQPREIVALVNSAMTPHLQALEAFVTVAYLRMDLKANTVSRVGCGHEESLIVDSQGGTRLLGNQHPPLGLLMSESVEQDECELRVGDSVFLCSDGVADALLDNGERLGHERIHADVAKLSQTHRTPAMVLHALRRNLLLDRVKITDDLTMVMLVRSELQHESARMEIPVSLDSLSAIRTFVETHTQSAGLPEERVGLLSVAAVEVVTNIFRHTSGLVPDAPIEMIIEKNPQGLALDIKYLGDGFTPPQTPTLADLSTFPEGGFGLHIIHHACDRVEYLHADGVNTVHMQVNRSMP